MRVINRLLSIIGMIESSVMLYNISEAKIDPPDLIISRSGRYLVTRFLVCRDVEYSASDLSEKGAKDLVESYIALFNALPPGIRLYLIKEELDISNLLKKVVNEILNTQADLDSAPEESTKVKLGVKLNKLRALYESLLNGKPFARISLVLSYRVESESADSAKSIADYYESIIKNSFRSHYGLKLERATREDIIQIILGVIGLIDKPSIDKIEVEAEKISQFQPMSIDKLPAVNRTVILGFERDSLHPVELKPEDLFKHLAIIGPTGRGKTTLLSGIIEQLVAENIVNVIAIDFKGDLKRYLANNLLTVLTPSEATINLLEKPQDVEDADWRAVVVESLTLASGASSEAILKALITVENEGEQGLVKYHYTSVLLPFIEFLKNKANYHTLIHNLGKNVIISVDGFGTTFQNAYVSLCIGLVRHLLLNKKDKLKTLLAIDDAWRVLRLKTLSEIVREGRSRELGVIISTQNPDDLPDEIAENIHNIVLFGSRNKEYLKKAEKLAGIKEDIVASLMKLGVGEALFVNVLEKEVKVIKTHLPLSMQKMSNLGK